MSKKQSVLGSMIKMMLDDPTRAHALTSSFMTAPDIDRTVVMAGGFPDYHEFINLVAHLCQGLIEKSCKLIKSGGEIYAKLVFQNPSFAERFTEKFNNNYFSFIVAINFEYRVKNQRGSFVKNENGTVDFYNQEILIERDVFSPRNYKKTKFGRNNSRITTAQVGNPIKNEFQIFCLDVPERANFDDLNLYEIRNDPRKRGKVHRASDDEFFARYIVAPTKETDPVDIIPDVFIAYRGKSERDKEDPQRRQIASAEKTWNILAIYSNGSSDIMVSDESEINNDASLENLLHSLAGSKPVLRNYERTTRFLDAASLRPIRPNYDRKIDNKKQIEVETLSLKNGIMSIDDLTLPELNARRRENGRPEINSRGEVSMKIKRPVISGKASFAEISRRILAANRHLLLPKPDSVADLKAQYAQAQAEKEARTKIGAVKFSDQPVELRATPRPDHPEDREFVTLVTPSEKIDFQDMDKVPVSRGGFDATNVKKSELQPANTNEFDSGK